MNLIKDAWILVRRKNGKVERIAPWQVTEGIDNDAIVELAAPRPDFNGALVQFLIGLLQTTCAPENGLEWRKWLKQPPCPDELQTMFEPVAYAFELEGDGPRFMQDFRLETEDAKPIYELLIDMPTGKTLEDNKDHFIKRGGIEQLCLSCASTALFTLQTNAPSGGQGHWPGLRGGGPMTTLVLAETLWKTCWLNVLERQTFLPLANKDKNKDSDRFPWLAPTRITLTSKNDEGTTPEDTHPDQIFWSMPRRVRLRLTKENGNIPCHLCGISSEHIVRYYTAKNHGVRYTGPWLHPLSPYFISADGTPNAIHPQPGGIGYRHWLGLVHASGDNNGKRQPARAIEHFIREKGGKDLRLWAFGYDIIPRQKNARCWYDSTMPLILADDTVQEEYKFHTAALVNSAQQVCSQTRTQIKKALFKRPGDVKGDLSFIDSRFWQETETDFFKCLYNLRDALEKDSDVVPILEGWHRRLVKEAESVFNNISQTGAFDAADPKRIALAWRDLQRSIHSKKLREQLGLPVKTQAEKITGGEYYGRRVKKIPVSKRRR